MSQPNHAFTTPPAGSRLTASQELRDVVIAEDDDATRALLVQVLSNARFTVRACENGELACAEVRRAHPSVVLVDWVMPVMDGRSAVASLKSDPQTRGIPIIMLTGQAELDECVSALETGVQDFLTKPFEPRELVARIEQQIRWRKTLAVDANVAFTADRLKLYGPGDSPQSVRVAEKSTFFDRIWGPDPSAKRR